MDIVVDGECISSPIVREPLCSQESFCITANDMTEARVLAHRLRTGTKTGPRPI
jgi:preprotein translocase subunit SecD